MQVTVVWGRAVQVSTRRAFGETPCHVAEPAQDITAQYMPMAVRNTMVVQDGNGRFVTHCTRW
jgi:hypothetical protein